MKTNKQIKLVAVVTAAALLVSSVRLNADDDPPPQNVGMLLPCIVAGVAVVAVATVVIIVKRCSPKYYCMRDDENPPNYFVGNATKKECQINGWTRINGPYDSAADVPPCDSHTVTNIQQQASAPLHITVEQSADLNRWSVAGTSFCDLDDFYFDPTNAAAMYFRIKIAP